MRVEGGFGPTPKLPTPRTLFGEIDNRLKASAGDTRNDVVASMRSQIKRRSGRTAQTTTGSVRKSKAGFRVVVGNSSRAHILRFLQTGTGERGPTKKRIPIGRRGMMGGRPPSGRGMRPQKTLSRMLTAVHRDVMPGVVDEMRDVWNRAIAEVIGRAR